MSRRFERTVERNTKRLNKQRAKRGVSPISQQGQEALHTFKGRSWVLPLLLIAFSLFFTIAFGGVYSYDSTFWITVCSYLGLALLIYGVRRPVLRIGKSHLITRRYTGDKTVNAGEIEAISLPPGYAIVRLNSKSRWVFSRLLHRYPMAQLTEELRAFAQRNGIPLTDEADGKKTGEKHHAG